MTTPQNQAATQRDFTPLLVCGTNYDIRHLINHRMFIDVTLPNKEVRRVTVSVRPTNHLYTREYDRKKDADNRSAMMANGELIKSYEHKPNDFQQVNDPLTWKEDRVFCLNKYNDNLNLPDFVSSVQAAPSNLTVLANSGDDLTCLSGLMQIVGNPNVVYLVFFKLGKVKGNQVNMLINTAFCVDMNNPAARSRDKVERLNGTKGRLDTDRKPFIQLVLNVVEGRKPFENATNKNVRALQKKAKKAKIQKSTAIKKDSKAKKKARKAAALAQMSAQQK